MARTQMNKHGIADRNLTGASMITAMGIWDETISYNINQEIFWNTKIYKCTTATTGSEEGDISGAPDINSSDWVIVTSGAPANTFASCFNGGAQTFSDTEVKVELSNVTNTTDITINTSTNRVEVNTAGRYRLTYKINLDDTGNQRIITTTYFKLNGVQMVVTKAYAYLRNSNDSSSTSYFSGTINLNAGDYIETYVIVNSNHNCQTIASESYFEFEYIAIT